jgi:hypothetical protein
MSVNLQDIQAKYQSFDDDKNPPILHEKDQLVASDYPFYKQFVKLTKQEKKAGLLDNIKAVNRLKSWEKFLKDHQFYIEKYQLFSIK